MSERFDKSKDPPGYEIYHCEETNTWEWAFLSERIITAAHSSEEEARAGAWLDFEAYANHHRQEGFLAGIRHAIQTVCKYCAAGHVPVKGPPQLGDGHPVQHYMYRCQATELRALLAELENPTRETEH